MRASFENEQQYKHKHPKGFNALDNFTQRASKNFILSVLLIFFSRSLLEMVNYCTFGLLFSIHGTRDPYLCSALYEINISRYVISFCLVVCVQHIWNPFQLTAAKKVCENVHTLALTSYFCFNFYPVLVFHMVGPSPSLYCTHKITPHLRVGLNSLALIWIIKLKNAKRFKSQRSKIRYARTHFIYSGMEFFPSILFLCSFNLRIWVPSVSVYCNWRNRKSPSHSHERERKNSKFSFSSSVPLSQKMRSVQSYKV